MNMLIQPTEFTVAKGRTSASVGGGIVLLALGGGLVAAFSSIVIAMTHIDAITAMAHLIFAQLQAWLLTNGGPLAQQMSTFAADYKPLLLAAMTLAKMWWPVMLIIVAPLYVVNVIAALGIVIYLLFHQEGPNAQ